MAAFNKIRIKRKKEEEKRRNKKRRKKKQELFITDTDGRTDTCKRPDPHTNG